MLLFLKKIVKGILFKSQKRCDQAEIPNSAKSENKQQISERFFFSNSRNMHWLFILPFQFMFMLHAYIYIIMKKYCLK